MDRPLGAARMAAALAVAIVAVVVVPPSVVRGTETVAAVVAAGLAGCLVPQLLPHPFRGLGVCPPAALLTAAAVGWAMADGGWSGWAAGLGVFAAGLIAGAVIRYEGGFRPRGRPGWPARGLVRVVPTKFDRVCLAGLTVCVLASIAFADSDPEAFASARPTLQTVLAALLLAHCWTRLFRPFFELCVEMVVWRGYRITAAGDGQAHVPVRGPALVIANHACWWDPLFLAKVLPRPITPMMTSAFYDRWFLRPLMVHVFQTIRVADVHIRREAPEIQQAIQALDEGKCVVIFPEGYLRRKEEVPLRRFGRGVWEILKARPGTPVVACWIEGSWGSYASYWNGPPTKNKTAERRRPIRVGVLPPVTVPAAVLEHHLRTRLALMNQVSAAREPLGLPPLPQFDLAGAEERENPT